MILKANQKYIDMSSVRHLLAMGEKNADYLTFDIIKNYHNIDLSECSFILRAVNSAGNLVEQTLKKQVDSNSILLIWRVELLSTCFLSVCSTRFPAELTARKIKLHSDKSIL